MTNGRAQRSGGVVAAAGAPTRRAAEDLRDLLTRSTLAIERHRAAIGRQLALGDSEMHALACLDQQGELTPGELRARLSLSSGGTTALVQRLERAGHVERRGHPRDRRSVVISLSPATRELLRSSAEPLVAAIDAAAAELSPGQRARRSPPGWGGSSAPPSTRRAAPPRRRRRPRCRAGGPELLVLTG